MKKPKYFHKKLIENNYKFKRIIKGFFKNHSGKELIKPVFEYVKNRYKINVDVGYYKIYICDDKILYKEK